MKWLVAAALIALVGTMAVTVAAARFAPGTEGGAADPPAVSSPANSLPIPDTTGPSTEVSTPSAPDARRFTLAQIAEHRSSTSCWLIISGRVYDVTGYLSHHPGGSRTILPWCGEESTEAFATEDGRGEHSSRAYADLKPYSVGVLSR